MKNVDDTRDVTPRPGSPLWIYFIAVSIAGAVLLVAAVTKHGHPAHTLGGALFCVVAAMTLAGEIWRIGRASCRERVSCCV